MFDIGWSELILIAVVAIIVVGPKDLPSLLHTVGKYVGQIKKMARDFQRQFDDAVRESELDQVRKSVDELSSVNPLGDVEESIQDVARDIEDFSKVDTKPNVTQQADQATAQPAASDVKPEA